MMSTSAMVSTMVNKPRGRMSAYGFFIQICRNQHKVDFPNDSFNYREFSKNCRAKWLIMSDKEKEPFFALAENDKKRYADEIEKYGLPSKKRTMKQKKDPYAPKKGLSSFLLFCNDERPKVRAEFPTYKLSEMGKELGRRWSILDPSLKKEYVDKAFKEKERYDMELVRYKSNLTANFNIIDNNQNELQTRDI